MSDDAFHLFPMLPSELRIKIWEFTFPGPRILEVIRFENEWFCASESRCKPCPAPFANREANELFLEKWSRITLRQVALHTRNKTPSAAISYFNPHIDTLYIGASSIIPDTVSTLTEMDFAWSTRLLAYEIREGFEYDDVDPQKDWELGFLAEFPKLESLIIADYDIDWRYISDGSGQLVGEIELVSPTQMDMKNENEIAPYILRRLANLAKSHPEANIPPATVKAILRGGVRMEYN